MVEMKFLLEVNVFQWILLILGSAALAFVLRKSLFQPRSHGFHRFCAWEILWIMFLLNAAGWFENPLVGRP
jgi:hypothetical protein